MRNLLLGVVLFLSACGGGGGSDMFIPSPIKIRDDLLFGYFGTNPTQVSETKGHVNLLWEEQWFGESVAISNMLQAQLPTVLDVSWQVYSGPQPGKYANPDREENLRLLFIRLRTAGVLQFLVALYPMDEPDINVMSEDDVLKVNESVRKVISEFPELQQTKLAVIYGNGRRFGFSTYDWVGFDDYDAKSSIFVNGGSYQSLKNSLLPGQRTIIIPGGASGQDIVPFVNFAQSNPEVIAVVPFIWFDGWANDPARLGIRSLPVRQAYCLAGSQIKTHSKEASCQS